MALALSELAGRTRPDIFVNPRAARPDVEADERSAGIFTDDRFREAIQEISSWPGYVETPLLALNGLAREFGVGQVWYKDEGDRFGLGSFKALGGAYAVYRILADRVRQHRGDNLLDGAALADGRYRHITGQVTVTTATDGNHGRSVAWGAHKFGCDCVIYIHRDVSSGRERAITRHGAEVVRVDGNYDDAVRRAAADAERERRVVVSDTSYEGNTEILCFVMDGYAVMVAEALRQVPPGELPTHVFVQAGVGALAAAVVCVSPAGAWRAPADTRRRRAHRGGVPARERPRWQARVRARRSGHTHGRPRCRGSLHRCLAASKAWRRRLRGGG